MKKFRLLRFAEAQDKPNCKKGHACGQACIPRAKKCISELGENPAQTLGKMAKLLARETGVTEDAWKKRSLDEKQQDYKAYVKKMDDFLASSENPKIEDFEDFSQFKASSGDKETVAIILELYTERSLPDGAGIGAFDKEIVKNIAKVSEISGFSTDSIIGGLQYTSNSDADSLRIELTKKAASRIKESTLDSMAREIAIESTPSQNHQGKIRASMRSLLNDSHTAEGLKQAIAKISNGDFKLSNDELTELQSLFSKDAIDVESHKNGTALLAFAVMNKMAKSGGEDTKELLNSLIDSPLSKSFAANNGNDRLYLGGVGDPNKLYKKSGVFGSGNTVQKVLISPELNNFLKANNKLLIKSDKAIKPKFLNEDSDDALSLKKIVAGSLQGFSSNKIDKNSPEAVRELKQRLPNKKFNGGFIDGKAGFEKLLDNLANTQVKDKAGNEIVNSELVKNDVDEFRKLISNPANTPEDFEKLFNGNFVGLLGKFGLKATEAAEYIAIAHEAYTKDKQGLYLDLFDGKPFPFADSAIYDASSKEMSFVSVKWGESGGVPADTGALINLTRPDSREIIGSPGKANADWKNYKAENSPIDFDEEGHPKLKEGKGRADLESHLRSLDGHFNFSLLEQKAKEDSNSPEAKAYSKINSMLDAIDSGDNETLNTLFKQYDFSRMQKSYSAEKVDKIPDLAKKYNTKATREAVAQKVKEERLNGLSNEEVLKLTPKELLKKYGIVGAINSDGSLDLTAIYEHFDLQLSLSHLAMGIFAQEAFNDFFNSSTNNKAIENHPDVSPSDGLSDEQCENGTALKFSNRTDAGASSRESSGGTQYKKKRCL